MLFVADLIPILGFLLLQAGVWVAYISFTSPWRVLESTKWIGLLMAALGIWIIWGHT